MVTLPDPSKLKFEFPKKLQIICYALLGVGLLLTLLGFLGVSFNHVEEGGGHGEHHALNPQFFNGILFATLFAIPLGLSGVYFAAFNHVSGAAWSVTIRRIAENFYRFLWVALVLMIIVFIGMGDVYHHWLHAPESDTIIPKKTWWLNVPRFIAMNVIGVGLWILFGWLFKSRSVSQDSDGSVKTTRTLAKFGAGFLVIFGLTYSANSWDLSMSTDPHWFSTLWAIYVFAGFALTLFATLALWSWYLKGQGYYGDSLNENHLHDVSKFMWGHTIFWAYMAISQYMLYWYGLIPEEVVWYTHRWHGGWEYLTFAVPMLRFVLPFFLIIRREWKRKFGYMAGISVLIIVGQLVDTYWMIYPALTKEMAGGHFWIPGPAEIGPILAVIGLYILIVGKGLEKNSLIPQKDPRLEECLHFHQ